MSQIKVMERLLGKTKKQHEKEITKLKDQIEEEWQYSSHLLNVIQDIEQSVFDGFNDLLAARHEPALTWPENRRDALLMARQFIDEVASYIYNMTACKADFQEFKRNHLLKIEQEVYEQVLQYKRDNNVRAIKMQLEEKITDISVLEDDNERLQAMQKSQRSGIGEIQRKLGKNDIE